MADKAHEKPFIQFVYPSYDELPDGLMFVGAIVDYVNQVHAVLPSRVRRNKVFTTAMATNYVKGGLTSPAIGRRYSRDHLSLLLFAATAKLCFLAEEVYWLAGKLFRPDDIRASHDNLKRAFDCAFAGKPSNTPAAAVARALVDRIESLSE